MHLITTILLLTLLQASPVSSDVVAESDLKVEVASGPVKDFSWSWTILRLLPDEGEDGSRVSLLPDRKLDVTRIPTLGGQGRRTNETRSWFLDAGAFALVCLALVAFLLLLVFVDKKFKKASPPPGKDEKAQGR